MLGLTQPRNELERPPSPDDVRAVQDRKRVWADARAEQEQAKAHSAPVYVVIDEQGFANSSAVDDIIGRMLQRLAEFDTVQVDVGSELETWSVGPQLTKMFAAQRAKILQRVDKARRVYAQMLDQP